MVTRLNGCDTSQPSIFRRLWNKYRSNPSGHLKLNKHLKQVQRRAQIWELLGCIIEETVIKYAELLDWVKKVRFKWII